MDNIIHRTTVFTVFSSIWVKMHWYSDMVGFESLKVL